MPGPPLSPGDLTVPLQALRAADQAFARRFPGAPAERQPVHTLYVPAHRFNHLTAAAYGRQALQALETWAPDAAALAGAVGMEEGIAEGVYARVVEKLLREPVEDLRVDFEDGFGARSGAEEDAAALTVAEEVALGMEAGSLPARVGVRLRSLAEETRERSCGTLEGFLLGLLQRTGGRLPGGFVLTLPKVTVPEQVAFFAALLERWEERLGLPDGVLRFETMVEVPQAVIGPDGACPLPRWVEAARGRMTGVHLGVYDYTASLGIAAPLRGIRHPSCDFARHTMQVALAETGVWVSDGSTALLPVPVHGGAPLPEPEQRENRAAVHRAWRRHFEDVSHSLGRGFHQGWDLHPAQLPTRYAAVFAFFLGAWKEVAAALRTIRSRGSDDPHAADALRSFVRRGIVCGAFTEAEAAAEAGTDAIRTR